MCRTIHASCRTLKYSIWHLTPFYKICNALDKSFWPFKFTVSNQMWLCQWEHSYLVMQCKWLNSPSGLCYLFIHCVSYQSIPKPSCLCSEQRGVLTSVSATVKHMLISRSRVQWEWPAKMQPSSLVFTILLWKAWFFVLIMWSVSFRSAAANSYI